MQIIDRQILKMKDFMPVGVGSRSSAVALIFIIAVAGLIINVRVTSVLTPNGSQQLKAKSTHDAHWALEIAGNAATAFLIEMDHGINNDDDDDDDKNDDIDDTLLSVPAQSPQVKVAGISEMRLFSFWDKNDFCKVINNLTVPDADMSSQLRIPTHQPPALPVVVNFTFGCKELFQHSVLGTGNWLSSFYAMRMAALVHGGVDVLFTCPDAEEEKKSLIIPWLMGYFPARTNRLQRDNAPTLNMACKGYNDCPIGHMIPYMRHELRRMAIALVGIPYESHPATAFAKKYMQSESPYGTGTGMGTKLQLPATAQDEPLFPGTEIDDACLHFRCGDLMMSNHPSFGFMKFSAFSKRIANDTKSIGIVTQPFDNVGQSRKEDTGKAKQGHCQDVVLLFRDHLAEKFPDAKIRIHNGRNETIALTYARMVMAKQTISPISSFSVFPALATFGRGYIRRPDFRKAPNLWLKSPPVDELFDNIELINEPNRLMVGEIKFLRRREGGNDNVFKWFQNDTFCVDKCKE